VDDVTARADDAIETPRAGLRIGELSRRVGMSADALRAWERRYGVPRPWRSASGQRLYSPEDEARVRRMLHHVRQGFSPAVAARMVGDEPDGDAVPPDGIGALAAGLRATLEALEGAAAQGVLDRLLAGFALDTVLRDVVLPYLADLGDRWERREVTVGQEHFASALVAGRLHGLARGWDAGVGPRALLACPSDERHELGLLCFGLALRERGWRVVYLGADTPAAEVIAASERVAPAVVVLAAVRPEPLLGAAPAFAALGGSPRLCAGGRGATDATARRLHAQRLPDDPIRAADLVSAASGA
jgi:DNA-binding transcriptional MerR regulator